MNDDYDFTLAFDVNKMRVGCVLIQAALGATIPRGEFDKHFPVEMWDVSSSGMQLFKTKYADLPKIADKIASQLHNKENAR